MSADTIIKPDKETKAETKTRRIILFPIIHRFLFGRRRGSLRGVNARKPNPGTAPLGIYYHAPFCRKRCHFCYFRVYTDKNSHDVRRYMDATISELKAYANSPTLPAENRSSFILVVELLHICLPSN